MINNSASSQGGYVVTEQGDLGLGLTPITEDNNFDSKKEQAKKDKKEKK